MENVVKRPRLSTWQGIKLASTRLLDFGGRSRRSEFWPWFIFVWILEIAIFFLVKGFGEIPLFFLVLFLRLGVCIRRLHDTGHGGTIVMLMALAGIIFHCSYGITDINGHQLLDHNFLIIIGVIYNLLMIYVLIMAMKDSDKRDNRFDVSPKYY